MSDRGGRTPGGLRGLLIGVLVMLVLLLGGLTYFIVSILEPTGAPTEAQLPDGIEWIRSIYNYGPGSGEQLISPDHTFIAADGTIWVSDTQLNLICSFAPDGSPRERIEFSALSPEEPWTMPKGIAVSADGEIYVCGSNANRLFVVNATGELLRSWEVEQPLDCWIAGDRVYVTGAIGVSVFTTQGEFIGMWGGRGKGPAQLDLPQGVVVGEDGTVYISDTLNARVKAFTSEGEFIGMTASGITGGGDQEADSSSSEEEVGTGLQIPTDICIDGNGRLVLVDPFGFNMVVIDTESADIIGRYGDFGDADGLFAYPTGISYDSDRDWFAVADTANKRVQIVRIPGSGSAGIMPAVRRAFVGPVWIAVPLGLLLSVGLVTVLSRKRRKAGIAGKAVERETIESSST
ncbi:MAG: NHL repeat-containing protein [Coriobacteriia bacterium]|nr:NHL repeat-containing protein [Coriobacteriia bacterium]